MLVRDMFGQGKVDGDFGLEVELEGNNLAYFEGCKLFKLEHDGSLRNGLEVVLKEPTKMRNLKPVLEDLQKAYNKASVVPSIRCGVHVHVNATDMTLQELANLIALYYMVEPLILTQCGEGRDSNLFCLPAYQAEGQLYAIHKFFSEGDPRYLNDHVRYCSMNLTSLRKFGSVEFRALRTPNKDNLESIKKFTQSLFVLKDLAKQYKNPTEILRNYSERDYEGLIRKLLPYYAEDVLKLDWLPLLKVGMYVAQDVTISYNLAAARYVPKAKPKAKPKPLPEHLPEAVQRMIEDLPHVDPQEILAAYERRFNLGA